MTFLSFIDSLHGRRISRAFWDYYKVSGVIDDSCYKVEALNASDSQGPGEAEFSMLRLKDIERQRELFDDMESESESETSEDDEFTRSVDIHGNPKTKRSGSLDTLLSERFKIRSDSQGSSLFKDFVHDKNFDFLAYKHELRRAQFVDWCKARRGSEIKVVGKNSQIFTIHKKSMNFDNEIFCMIFFTGKAIEPPDDGKHVMWSDMLSSSPFSKSLDDSESLYMLPYYLKPKEEPTRKILTISTLQLHRAINDRIQDEINLEPRPIPKMPRSRSTSQSIQEVFPFDRPRMKVVGGGGVIAKYESPFRSKVITNSGSLSSRTLPSHMTLRRGDLGRENVHAEIRLDQVKTI